MAVRLRQLYQSVQDEFEIILVAGEGGLDHVVRWVHMVESVDISSFLEGDEIAFTTGIALSSEADLLDLVKYNEKKQAAGMVINIGPYIKSIPQEVIAFGNTHAFPIFEVPWRVHMAHIMREFARQITLDDFARMELETAFSYVLFSPEDTRLYLPALQRLGYKKEWSYCVMTMEFWENQVKLAPEKLAKYTRYAKELFFFADKHHFIYVHEGILIAVFVNQSENQVKLLLENYLDKIHSYFDKTVCAYIGVGRCMGNVEDAAKSYETAEQIRKLQYRRHHKNEVLTYQQLGAYKLLFSLDTKEMEEFFDETMGALVRYDHMNETDYMHFLKQYFEKECSVQAVADEFHLHRNSVAYKLHKIEEILGMPVTANHSRMKIMLAIMVQELL